MSQPSPAHVFYTPIPTLPSYALVPMLPFPPSLPHTTVSTSKQHHIHFLFFIEAGRINCEKKLKIIGKKWSQPSHAHHAGTVPTKPSPHSNPNAPVPTLPSPNSHQTAPFPKLPSPSSLCHAPILTPPSPRSLPVALVPMRDATILTLSPSSCCRKTFIVSYIVVSNKNVNELTLFQMS